MIREGSFKFRSHDLVILANNTAESFAKKLTDKIPNAHYVGLEVPAFPDNEIDSHILESIRGADVFFICPFYPNPLERYTEISMVSDAIQYASAGRITFVPTYEGFMRKDWKDKPRTHIGIRKVAQIMEMPATYATPTRVLSMDMHSPQVQGVFRIPLDHLEALPVVKKYIEDQGLRGEDIVVVSPDVGGAKFADRFAKVLGAELAIIYKRREGPDKVEARYVIGDVKDRLCLIVDDQYSTGSTMSEGQKALKREGAENALAFATHAVLCQKNDGTPAEDVLRSGLKESGGIVGRYFATDTIPRQDMFFEKNDHIGLLSVIDLFAEAIDNIHNDGSISNMFDYNTYRHSR